MENTYKIAAVILVMTMLTATATSCTGGDGQPSGDQATELTIPVSLNSETSDETVPSEPLPSVPSPTPIPADANYVRMLSDVTVDMMNCDYWIATGVANGIDMDEILMDADQIAAFNEANVTTFEREDGTGMFSLRDIDGTVSGDDMRFLLEANRGQIPENPSDYYLNGSPTTASYWQALAALDNLDSVGDEVPVRYAYTVKRATLRLFPTEDRVFEGSDDQYFDYLLFSECMPYRPAVILLESTDGNYYYAVFDSYAAWVRKDVIAFCHDRDEWVARQNREQYLTVTEREIRLGNDPYSPATSNLVLPMGTKMELVPVSEAPSFIGQRSTYGDYVVKVPTRGSDGYIADEYVLIPFSDDVTVGVLPLTPANVVRQAFKLLGDRYGWGGDLQANDCTGISREIYSTFGVQLPRTRQSLVTGVHKVSLTDMNEAERLDAIGQLAPGSLVAMSGHMTIYIGNVNGRPYVISSVGGLSEPAPGPADRITMNSVVLSSMYVRLRSGKTWLESMSTAVEFRPE